VVKLADGRVLVAGGRDGAQPTPNYLSSAEIYDPATGAFSPTGSMGTGRLDPNASLLADGRVLIAGGSIDTFNATNTAEVYDPATGTFSPTASMAVAREGSTSTLLSDGRVFIAGGATGTFNAPAASTTLYNPDGGIDHTGSFSGGVPMTTGRSNATATLLPGDKILIAGGQNTFLNYYDTADIWTPTTTIVATDSMSVAHAGAVSSLLPGGKVLIVGGSADSVLATAVGELYNPTAGTFSDTGSLATARSQMAGSGLADGRVLVAGGVDNSNNLLDSAEVYDPASGTFGATGNMSSQRWGASAVTLDSGRVLLVGGLGSDNKPVATTDLFYPNGFPFDMTVTSSGTGSGSVTSTPAGIDCGSTCSATFGRGDVVSLAATPAATSVFSGWSGACSGTGSCQVTMSEARAVTATFDVKPPAAGPKLHVLSVTPKSKKLAPGKQAKFKFRFENTGDTATGNLKACVTAPKKLVSIPKCLKPKSLAPGGSGSASFKVKVKKKAKKGKKAKLTFTVSAPGLKKATATAKLKVK